MAGTLFGREPLTTTREKTKEELVQHKEGKQWPQFASCSFQAQRRSTPEPLELLQQQLVEETH
eukprot:818284-Amphidinium_carterae.1